MQVVSEGLFDDHPPPSFPRLLRQPRLAELLDYRAEEPVSDRQIEQDVGGTKLLLPLGQQPLEMAEGLRLSKVSRHIVHALGEPRPCLSINPGRLRDRLQHLGQALAPLL